MIVSAILFFIVSASAVPAAAAETNSYDERLSSLENSQASDADSIDALNNRVSDLEGESANNQQILNSINDKLQTIISNYDADKQSETEKETADREQEEAQRQEDLQNYTDLYNKIAEGFEVNHQDNIASSESLEGLNDKWTKYQKSFDQRASLEDERYQASADDEQEQKQQSLSNIQVIVLGLGMVCGAIFGLIFSRWYT